MIAMETKKKVIHRSSKLRCLSCGSRDKKLVFLINKANDEDCVGFSTSCCNCGHIHTFAMKDCDKVKEDNNLKAVLAHNYNLSETMCGSHHKYCVNKGCSFWKRDHHPVNYSIPYSESVYTPGYEEKNSCTQHDKRKYHRHKTIKKKYL